MGLLAPDNDLFLLQLCLSAPLLIWASEKIAKHSSQIDNIPEVDIEGEVSAYIMERAGDNESEP